MTIFFFTGTPGSGKTYEAVEKILNNLRLGKCVYTNIDGMDDPHCQETLKVLAGLDDLQFGNQFHHLGNSREVIENFWDHCPERNSLIVLDEVQKYFSNRDWQATKNRLFGDWASTHRHEGYDLVIITQNAERIDSAVRSLTEWNYCFRKINFFGSLVQKGYLCNIYAGEDTAGQPLKRASRRYKSKIFSCYQSYAAKDIKEQSIMPTINVLRHPVFLAIPIVLGFTVYMIFFKSSLATGDIFGTKKIQQKALSVIDASEAKASTPPSSPGHDQGASVVSSSQSAAGIPAAQSSLNSPELVAIPPIIHRVKLNYAEYTREGKILYLFVFRGQVFTKDTFPYPITGTDGRLYADIPETDLPSEKAS
jgi:zona occludens toxin (predicted ATPase)